MPQPEAMLISVVRGTFQGQCLRPEPLEAAFAEPLEAVFAVRAVIRNHVEAHDRASTDCKGRGDDFCCDIGDCRGTVEKEDMEGFCDKPYSPTAPKRNSLDGKPPK